MLAHVRLIQLVLFEQLNKHGVICLNIHKSIPTSALANSLYIPFIRLCIRFSIRASISPSVYRPCIILGGEGWFLSYKVAVT